MYLKASYTVEGAVVISVALIIITACILLSFTIYRESIEYIQLLQIKDIDSVSLFRKINVGKTVLESFK